MPGAFTLLPTLAPPMFESLASRGVSPTQDPDESRDTFDARLETALMALFRDRRGEAEFQALYDFSRTGLLLWITALLANRRSPADPLEILQDTYVSIY